MIAYLSGKILFKTDDSLVIENQGLGYEIHVSEDFRMTMHEGDLVTLYIYHHLTENSEGLYGFDSLYARGFFMLLLSVSGIGPRIALGIMNVSTEIIASALLNGDIDALTELPGIGKKTAERMILDLRNKVVLPTNLHSSISKNPQTTDHRPQTSHQTPLNNIDALNALVSLGYSRLEATRMLGQVPVDVVDTQEIVKYALKSN